MGLAENNPRLFGNFSTESKLDGHFDATILQFDPSSSHVMEYSSTVFAVSEKYAWEQELMRFKRPITKNVEYEDLE